MVDSLRLFLSRQWMKIKIAWSVARGHDLALHMAVVREQPIAARLFVQGTLRGADNTVMLACTVEADGPDTKDGIVVGRNSMVIGCSAIGWRGVGLKCGP